jgi:hypothetical protein
MKMVKRTLIAIAVVALIATSVQATDLPNGSQKQDGAWPTEYKALDLCIMPITIDIGMYVQLIDCADKKIELVQVTCSNMDNFPCYYDCESFQVRANFNAILGTKLSDKPAIVGGTWSAAFDGLNTVPSTGVPVDRKVCVTADKVSLWDQGPNDALSLGTLTITVKPE